MITLIYFIIILGVIVTVHEFGHFIFSKMFGIYVYEFSIGFGPKIFKWTGKNKETSYSIRLIPLGGFVSLAGEEIEEDKNIPKGRRLQDKPIWQRFLVMFFGAGNNFIFAIIVLFAIGLFFGSTSTKPILSKVTKGYPAYEAGLRSGDTVLKINNHKIKTMDDLSLYVSVENPKKPVTFVIKKETGKVKNYTVKARKEGKGKNKRYVYGITMEQEKQTGFVNAIKYAFSKTASLFKQMFIIIKYLFTGKLSVNNLSGPVGIYSLVGEQRAAGLANILYLVAYLSINVGVINLLPFPAFDGGKILFLIIEKIKGSKVNPKVENIIHTIGFVLLMLLMLYVTIHDIIRLF